MTENFNLSLKAASSKEWIDAVLSKFDDFLRDHADCERKASNMAMSFVAKYPNRKEIIPELIATAIEEMEHFQQVYKIMARKGVMLTHQLEKDTYINDLIKFCRSGKEDRFMDRLIVASVVECRGAERFRLVSENVEDEDLKRFYKRLYVSEAKHGDIFVRFANEYFPKDEIQKRVDEFLVEEARILNSLKVRPALH